MLSQYLVNISRTSAKLLPQLEEGPSFQTEGPLTKKVKFGSSKCIYNPLNRFI